MVSSEDLVAWPELKKIAKSKKLSFLSSNIVAHTGKNLFDPIQIIPLEKNKLVVMFFTKYPVGMAYTQELFVA
jgi:hypothetical protein